MNEWRNNKNDIMLAQNISRGLNQRLFTFHTHFNRLLPLMATNATRVSTFSTGSPNYAPLKRVGTHNGSFHCDEALGCFMIRLTDKFSNAEIVRSRDPQVRFLSHFPVWFSRKQKSFNFYWFFCKFHGLNVSLVTQWSITFFKLKLEICLKDSFIFSMQNECNL